MNAKPFSQVESGAERLLAVPHGMIRFARYIFWKDAHAKSMSGFACNSRNDQYLCHFRGIVFRGFRFGAIKLRIRGELETLLEELRSEAAGLDRLTPNDVPRTCAHLCNGLGGKLEPISVLPGLHVRGKDPTVCRMNQ